MGGRVTEPLSDSELAAILVRATIEMSAAKFRSIGLARLLVSDVPSLVTELRTTREQLQSSRDQCRTMRAIIEGAEQVAT
jgi:hypothetical protein